MLGRDNTWYAPYPAGEPNSSAPVTFIVGGGISEAWALSTLINLYLTSGLAYLRMEAVRYDMVENAAAPNESYLVGLSTFDSANRKAVGMFDTLMTWLKRDSYGSNNTVDENYE